MPLRTHFVLIFLCGACAAPRVAHETVARPAPDTLAEQRLVLARDVIARSNEVRADSAAPALHEAPELMTAAQDYAVELAGLRRLSHFSDRRGRVTMAQRIEAAGGTWRRAAENLAATTGNRLYVPDIVVRMWLGSDGHRHNLLDPAFTATGVGVARDYLGAWYVVQLYVLPPSRP